MKNISILQEGSDIPETLLGEHPFKPLLLTIPQAAYLLGLSRAKLYRMMQCGELPVVRIGRAVRLSYASLERWVEQQENQDREESPQISPGFDLSSPLLTRKKGLVPTIKNPKRILEKNTYGKQVQS